MKLPQRADDHATLQALHVLVIEEQPAELILIDRLLRSSRRFRASVVGARSFEEATSRAQSETFDAVVCDVHVAGLTGLSEVRRVAGGLPDIPLIVISDTSDLEFERCIVQLGADDFLPKRLLANAAGPELLARTLIAAAHEHRHHRLRQHSLQCLANLIEANADGVLIVRADHTIASANQRAADLLRLPVDELEQSTFDHTVNRREPFLIRWNDDSTHLIIRASCTPLTWFDEPAYFVTLAAMAAPLPMRHQAA